jgi:hypothetical protein
VVKVKNEIAIDFKIEAAVKTAARVSPITPQGAGQGLAAGESPVGLEVYD